MKERENGRNRVYLRLDVYSSIDAEEIDCISVGKVQVVSIEPSQIPCAFFARMAAGMELARLRTVSL
jgi:hypothetical protein